MEQWVRTNGRQLVLGVLGVLTAGIGLAQDRDVLAVPLAVTGVVLVALAILLPMVKALKGPGWEIELREINRRVNEVEARLNAIAATGRVEARGEVVPPPPSETTSDERLP